MMRLPDSLSRFLLWLSGASVPEPGPSELPSTARGAPPGAADQLASPPPALPAATQAPFSPQEVSAVPEDDVTNDAIAYGVTVATADVPVGATFWRAVRVHHLTPDENHGNHHIFLDALDESGHRVQGAQARVTWEGCEQVVTVDKPADEPGTNFPMWKWQVCAVTMLGLPSDRVANLHTGHPDEPPGMGNTLFHHSFQVDFQRSVKGSISPPAQSMISGIVSNGEGLTLVLARDGIAIATTVLDASGAYRFSDLAAGTYRLRIDDTAVQSALIGVDGTSSATVDLTVPAEPPPTKLLPAYVLFGPATSHRTAVFLAAADDFLTSRRPTFGFRLEDAIHAQGVLILGAEQDVSQEAEAALVAAGCQVQRVHGTIAEIAAALETLISGPWEP